MDFFIWIPTGVITCIIVVGCSCIGFGIYRKTCHQNCIRGRWCPKSCYYRKWCPIEDDETIVDNTEAVGSVHVYVPEVGFVQPGTDNKCNGLSANHSPQTTAVNPSPPYEVATGRCQPV